MKQRVVAGIVLALFAVLAIAALLWAGQAQPSGEAVVQPVPRVAPSQTSVQPVKGPSDAPVRQPESPGILPVPKPLNPIPAVPRTMTYQGKLTNAAGQPVPDGNYQLILRLYTVPSGGSAIWTETDTVATKTGLFNVPMGAKVSLNLTFNQDYYLGVAAAGDPEMAPRTKLTSAGYAFRSDSSANADYVGGHAANWSGTSIVPYTDGTGRLNPAVIPAGGTPGPHGPTHSPGSTDTIPGLVKVSGDSMTGHLAVGATGSGSWVSGVNGIAVNSSSGEACGGGFSTSYAGTGVHYGVNGAALANSPNPAFGAFCWSDNPGAGEAIGGRFYTTSNGTGKHTGISVAGYGSTSDTTYGVWGYSNNSSNGTACGGYFNASSATGANIGVSSVSTGASSSPTYGFLGSANNTSSGSAFGGIFDATGYGTGEHYGVLAGAYGASNYPYTSYGIDAHGENTSTGDAIGCYGSAKNTSSGSAFGGQFRTSLDGTGVHYGVGALGFGSSSSDVYGVFSRNNNYSTGNVYGGYFEATSQGTGFHYGVLGSAFGASSNPAYGSYGSAENTSTGSACGGIFIASSNGSGMHYGVYGSELAGGSGAAVYGAGDIACSGTKSAVVRTTQGEKLVYCTESPEIWFEDVSEGRLVNGRAHIELDPLYLQTVTIDARHPMRVFVELCGDCNGVYVTKGRTGFDVVELKGGASNVSFDYRILAKRKGYEDERMRATNVGQDDPNLYPERRAEIEAKWAKMREAPKWPGGVK